jgi:hypothetical protein
MSFKRDSALIDELMSKRLAKFCILIIAWIGLNHSAALACACPRLPSPNEDLRRADVVFAGRAIAEGKAGWWADWIRFKWSPPFVQRTDAYYQSRTVFEVTTVWKGDVSVKTALIIESICGYYFRPGEEYIVYANRYNKGLGTYPCRRINKLSAAGEDLAAFGAGRPPTPNPSLAANYITALIVVFMLLSALGLSLWQARRKYGAQIS